MSRRNYTAGPPEDKSLEASKLETNEEESIWSTLTSCRWIMAYVSLLGFTMVYGIRINISMAMICMVKPREVNNTETEVNSTSVCEGDTSSTSAAYAGEIEWDKPTQGLILSSFFYGYIVTQIIGGMLAGKFGGRRVMAVCMFIYAVCNLLIPVASRYDGKDYQTSSYLVIGLRILMGMITGPVFPAMHTLWGRWAPPLERSKLTTVCYSGTIVGNVIMLGVAGFMCEWTAFDGGWPSIFYISGGIGILWVPLWLYCVHDSPLSHPRISKRERTYILTALGDKTRQKNERTPWLSIVTSPAVWAIVICHMSNNFGNYTLITKLPAYMKEVLQFNITQNGLFSALPYIGMFVLANMNGLFVDFLRSRYEIRTIVVRKVCQFLSLVPPALILVAMGYITCELRYLGLVALVGAVSLTGLNRAGYLVNHVDIAPRYSGEIFGLTNTFATIPGMVAPSIVTALTEDETQASWRMVFFIWAAVYTAGAIVFVIFAQAEEMPWAKASDEEEEKIGGYNPNFRNSETIVSPL